MKKFGKFIACVACVATCSAAFLTGCGGGGKSEAQKEKDFIAEIGATSETYTGAVSDTSYSTKEAAAAAYVADQVAGEKSVSVVGTTSNALDETQVAALNIPAEDMAGAQSVEEVVITYTEEGDSVMTAFGGEEVGGVLNKSKTVKVYIIKYETDWKYYTPCPATGETITKSYYDSVFDYAKYENCTMENSMTIVSKASYQGVTAKVTIGAHQLVKYAEGKIYIEQTATYAMTLLGETEKEVETISAYVEEDENGDINCYVKQDANGDWYEGSLTTVGFSSLEELVPFSDQYLDYTYFTKTDYGFKLDGENMQKYLELTIGEELEEMDFFSFGGKIDMFAKYYVCEGALTGMRMDMSIPYKVTEEEITVKGSVTAVSEVKITNYGTTVVEKPFTE